MIVVAPDGLPHGLVVDSTGASTGWKCLARRGMLHSECEAVDLVTLDPGARLSTVDHSGRAEAWFVVSGSGVLDDATPIGTGALVVLGPWTGRELIARSRLSVLVLSVLPDTVARRLPVRRPDMAPPPGRGDNRRSV